MLIRENEKKVKQEFQVNKDVAHETELIDPKNMGEQSINKKKADETDVTDA